LNKRSVSKHPHHVQQSLAVDNCESDPRQVATQAEPQLTLHQPQVAHPVVAHSYLEREEGATCPLLSQEADQVGAQLVRLQHGAHGLVLALQSRICLLDDRKHLGLDACQFLRSEGESVHIPGRELLSEVVVPCCALCDP